MEKLMTIRKLSAFYGQKMILRDISMDIEPNQITAVIGPSGCGKTTFLKTLNGLLPDEPGAKTEGEILLQGTDIRNLPREELRKRVGLVFQTPAPFPFSIYKNMTYAPIYHGIRDRKILDQIVKEKLVMTGLYEEVKDELNKSALKLSGGQMQRLCIARALTVEPEILLLDEPCSALDVKSSAVIEEMLMNLKGRYTIIIVTHNIAQAKRIADNAAFFFDGRLAEYAPAASLFSHPNEPETRAFLEGIYG
ncbi:MAG: phosphate ABC transporter ATP-binding protein [Enterocloster sp.]